MEQKSRLWIAAMVAVVLGATVLALTARAPRILPPEAAQALAKKGGAASEADSKVPQTAQRDGRSGVIQPPSGIDPEIHLMPPEGGAMKVIVPPAEPGGAPAAQPE